MSEAEMKFVERVFGFIDLLEDGGSDEPTARRGISALVSDCGFDHFTITRLPQPKVRLGPAMLLKSWHEPWLKHYDRSGHYRHDPVGRYCFQTTEPFVWSEVRYDADDAMAARVMNEAADHGLAHGFCVPIHGIAGFQAVASYAGRAVEMSARHRRALHLLSIAAYGWAERRERVKREANGVRLSPRERDVLSWTALGLKKGEVAERLGISVLTVRTHLDRCRQKMGTVNTVNTVVEALRRGELRL
jgi:LuxR family quorum sensing-dependent transcriptional regulator